jgi:cellulose synthase/poly-beta-1,6-N-acetylglucosamine synthase-like glycosyltransferase
MLIALTYFFISIYMACIFLITFYCLSQFNLLLRFRIQATKANLDCKTSDVCPLVTIQLPIFNEKFVVERLIDNIMKLQYPKDKLEIQILDDSTDDTLALTKKLADKYMAQGYDVTLIHRTDRTGFKAGALKHGLTFAKGEYIAIFDADFMPASDFLLTTLPYFAEANIGVVQVRWDHLNQTENLLTELQSFQLNVHFTIEQGGRCQAPYLLQFNGTAGVWRKFAIEDAGGWQADTLTEDLDLSYRAQLKGWKIKYLTEVASPAELPMEIAGLKSQQHRWMKGGAETAKKLLPSIWSSSLSMVQKIQATIHLMSSSFYLIVFLMGLVSVPLALLMYLAKSDYGLLKYLVVSLPFVIITYYYANVVIAWPRDNVVKRFVKFVFLFPIFLCISMGLAFHNSIAVIQGWMGKKSAFVRTPKKGEGKHFMQYQLKSFPAITMFEGLLFCYYLLSVCLGLMYHSHTFLLFHVMLTIGYGTIFSLSLSSLKFKT